MKRGCPREDHERVRRRAEEIGRTALPVPGPEGGALYVPRGAIPADPALFEELPGVERVVPLTRPYLLASRTARAGDSAVRIGPVPVGAGAFALIAGPCAVESESQLLPLARTLAERGADLLRGGAYKPRTSPYSFQGLGPEGLTLLARARAESGLPVVTEALDEESLARVAEVADAVQIGARNMHDTPLLRRAGRCGRPILLKRGAAATLEEWLSAAEYVLAEGNPDVVLCERGIRTFSDHSRYTLDLAVVPAVREASHLPVLVDPSHATGLRDRVAPMARAAVAAGADGVMVEVHANPERALSDGVQALRPEEFGTLAADLRRLRAALGATEVAR